MHFYLTQTLTVMKAIGHALVEYSSQCVAHCARLPAKNKGPNAILTGFRCYLRLVDNPRAKEALKAYLPKSLITAQLPFRDAAENDTQLMQLLLQLRSAVGIKSAMETMPGEQQGHQGSMGPGVMQGMQSGMGLPYGSAFQNTMQSYRPR